MKKIKKLLTIGLAVLLMLGMCFCLTGCVCEPYDIETWYIKRYIDENGEEHSPMYDTIKQERFYSDDITIQYFEDRTFIFKEFDKEYTGTYTYKKGKGKHSYRLPFQTERKAGGLVGNICLMEYGTRGHCKHLGKNIILAKNGKNNI